jgi:CHAT domain-containing protein/tetratricopeptide (TPR) repeat protein
MADELNPEYISQLRDASRLHASGADAEALPLAERALAYARDYVGPHPFTAAALNVVGHIYQAMARFSEADAIWIELLAMLRSADVEPAMIAATLSDRADLYKSVGRPLDALPMLEEALSLVRDSSSQDDLTAWATVLNNLGDLYRVLGRYGAAESSIDKALELRVALLGEQDLDYAQALFNAALLRKDQGRLFDAERLARQALSVFKGKFDRPHPNVAVGETNLAAIRLAEGHLSDALDGYARALDLWVEIGGLRHPRTAFAQANLAAAQMAAGRYDLAEPLLRDALEILRSYGDRDSRLAVLVSNLGGMLYETSDNAEAERKYRDALNIWNSSGLAQHQDAARCLDGLAATLRARGAIPEAIDTSRQAVATFEAAVGAEHPATLKARMNLAMLELDYGQSAGAQESLEAVRLVLEHAPELENPDLATCYSDLGSLELWLGNTAEADRQFGRALTISERTIGNLHPQTAAILHNLAIANVSLGNDARALSYERRSIKIENEALSQVFTVASERRRMDYLRQLQDEIHGLLALMRRLHVGSPDVVGLASDVVLQRKGIAAEVLAVQRDALLMGRYPDMVEVLNELRIVRAEIATQVLAGGHPTALQARREQLESDLAQAIPEIALTKDPRQIDHLAMAASVPEGTAVIEFFEARDFDFNAVPARGEDRWNESWYLAFVFAHGDSQFVDLGSASPINDLVTRLLLSLGSRGRVARDLASPITVEDTYPATAELLRKRVVDPLLPIIGDCHELVISPDGELCRLPFELLPLDDGSQLIDRYHLRYLSSARQLRRQKSANAAESGPPVVFADPDFALTLEPGDSAIAGIPFKGLPGTTKEGSTVGARLKVHAVVRDGVLKDAVMALRSPQILHFATHGFFLMDQDENAWWPLLVPRGRENALLRSGLALAGANASLHRRKLPAAAGNGLLYAEDVTALDLTGTRLVVLSACDTGRGDIELGEGVFGLRRAFEIAGAETLVMSLWPVSDDCTESLMDKFYTALLNGYGRAEALRMAQLEIRESYGHPANWAAFVCQGVAESLSFVSSAEASERPGRAEPPS